MAAICFRVPGKSCATSLANRIELAPDRQFQRVGPELACPGTQIRRRGDCRRHSCQEIVVLRSLSYRFRLPSFAILARQILVRLRHVRDFHVLGVVQQFLARPQGDGVQVDGFGDRPGVQETAGRLLLRPGRPRSTAACRAGPRLARRCRPAARRAWIACASSFRESAAGSPRGSRRGSCPCRRRTSCPRPGSSLSSSSSSSGVGGRMPPSYQNRSTAGRWPRAGT